MPPSLILLYYSMPSCHYIRYLDLLLHCVFRVLLNNKLKWVVIEIHVFIPNDVCKRLNVKEIISN